MAGQGGARPGAGRKKGGTNRVTREAQERAAASGELPLDFLLRIMRDANADEAKRIDCAKAAAQYVHPKLAAVEHSGEVVSRYDLSSVPSDRLLQIESLLESGEPTGAGEGGIGGAEPHQVH